MANGNWAWASFHIPPPVPLLSYDYGHNDDDPAGRVRPVIDIHMQRDAVCLHLISGSR